VSEKDNLMKKAVNKVEDMDVFKKEYRQFVGIAKGSAGELKYFLLLYQKTNTDTYYACVGCI
jgi:four helix bundle protein